MMLKENHQNLSCEFAEEIVSYLYNEMIEAEKSRFESHLENCSHCADEIAGFSMVRSEIVEWKEQDFESLATPIVEIPYPLISKPAAIAEVSHPWYAAVRDFFTLSPAWMTASTAMAVLAICAGLVFVTVNSMRDRGNVIVQEQKTPKPVSSPTTAVKKVDSNENTSAETRTESTDKGSTPPSGKDVPDTTPAAIKITERDVVKPQIPNTKKNSTPNNKAVKSNKRKSAPSLVGDEDEDDSLRLSDIFNEIGSR